MKKTMSTYDIVNELLADDNARWSRAAAFKLAEIFEEYEESTGEELEFDRVAIRCDWNEDTAVELISNYGEPWSTIEEVIADLEDKTQIYTVDNDPPTYLYNANF